LVDSFECVQMHGPTNPKWPIYSIKIPLFCTHNPGVHWLLSPITAEP